MVSYTSYIILCCALCMLFNGEVRGQQNECDFIEVETCINSSNGEYVDCLKQPCYIMCMYKPPTQPKILPKAFLSPCKIGPLQGKCRGIVCFPNMP